MTPFSLLSFWWNPSALREYATEHATVFVAAHATVYATFVILTESVRSTRGNRQESAVGWTDSVRRTKVECSVAYAVGWTGSVRKTKSRVYRDKHR